MRRLFYIFMLVVLSACSTKKILEYDKVDDLKKVEEYDKLYAMLADTNSQLWDLEDKIRALKSAPATFEGAADWLVTVKDTAFEIVTQNDKRAETIKWINALWGYNRQEKMY